MTKSRKAGTTAFTLIELMATIAIVGILLAGALGVVAKLSRSQAASRPGEGDGWLESRLRALVGMDVLHGERYRKLTKGFLIQTHGGLDAKTMELDHVGCDVTYEARQIGPRSWLVRTQQSQSSPLLTEMIAPGVKEVGVVSTGPEPTVSGDWRSIPPNFTVTVSFMGTPQRSLVLHFRTR